MDLLFIIPAIALVAAWPIWIMTVTPKSDGPRIKRDLEGEGRRVLSIERRGTELGGRSSPSYRRYEVVVEERGCKKTRRVGVQATWFSDPELKRYGEHWF